MTPTSKKPAKPRVIKPNRKLTETFKRTAPWEQEAESSLMVWFDPKQAARLDELRAYFQMPPTALVHLALWAVYEQFEDEMREHKQHILAAPKVLPDMLRAEARQEVGKPKRRKPSKSIITEDDY